MYEAVKDIKEDVKIIYKVTSVVFPDEEETEEFQFVDNAMNYAQEQIASGDYDEVIVSEVAIDEDGYEEETILLDEQCEREDEEEYEPQLTIDRMHAGQWYESFDEEKDKYSVLREALDILDREDNEGKKMKARAQIRNLRSKLREDKIRRYPIANDGTKIQMETSYSVHPINHGSKRRTELVWEALVEKAKDIIQRENIEYYVISKYIEPN